MRIGMFKNKQQIFFILLAVLSFVSLVVFLGASFFNTKGEPREAVVALSMLKTGDWISPINNGVDIAYKPPFFHWCVALCSLTIGRVTEFTARFPSAVATIVMLLAGYWYMLRNRVDYRLAFLTSIVTLTAFEVHRASMACRVDMVLSAFIVLAMYSYQRWFITRSKLQILITVLLLSGAFLTKGPVGALLPCAVVGVFMLIRGEKFYKVFLYCFIFVLLSCILPLCWYYMAYLERGDSFLYLVYEENVLRLLGKMVYSSHEAPAIYNVLTMITGFLPYTILLLFSLFVLKWHRPNIPNCITVKFKDMWKRLTNMSDQELLSLLATVLIFVFYCIPKSKRSVYLLPIYPFVAYFISKYMLRLASLHRYTTVVYGWFLSVVALLMPLLLLVLKLKFIPHELFHGKHAAENISYLLGFESMSFGPIVILCTIVIVLSVWFFISSRYKKDIYRFCYSLVGIVFAIYFMLDGCVLPQVFDVKTDFYVAQEIKKLVPQEEKIWDYRSEWKPGDRNRIHQFTIDFYLDDRIIPLDENKPQSGYLIMGDDDIESFDSKYSEYLLTKIRRFNHKSCDDKRYLTLYRFVTK